MGGGRSHVAERYRADGLTDFKDYEESMSDRHKEPNENTATGTRTDGVWHIQLPDRVGSKISDRIQQTEFDSVDEYVAFAMESLLRELDEQDGDVDPPVDHANDSENSEELRDRLESLGYM